MHTGVSLAVSIYLLLQAGRCKEPLEIYKYMYNRGTGKASAQLYKAWAFTLEESGNTQQADKILSQGIEANAQPLDALQKYRE